MIRAVSLSPCVDVSVEVDELRPGHKLRATDSMREPGGGGVNVALVADRLGQNVECVIAAGGATGAEVTAHLRALSIPTLELETSGPTRESIHIMDAATGDQYRIVVAPPKLAEDPVHTIERFRSGQVPLVAVFSGSAPGGVTDEVYGALAELHSQSFVIVDTAGPALEGSLRGPVDLIKPSLSEFEHLSGRQINTANELVQSAEEVLGKYERLGNIAVSLGSRGAILIGRTQPPVIALPPMVDAVSAVGAGDSMVAGIAVGIAQGRSLNDALRLGIACGAAAVTTPGSGMCTQGAALDLYSEVEVRPLDASHQVR